MKVLAEVPDSELVNKIIKNIEAIQEDKKERNCKLMRILPMLNAIKDEQFSMKQAEKIVEFLTDRDNLPIPEGGRNRALSNMVFKYEVMVVKKLVNAINIRLELTNDVDELRQMNSKLPYIVERIEPISVSTVKRKITSKITKIENERLLYEAENNFSDNIVGIVSNLTSENVNCDEIRKMINSEISGKLSCQNNGLKNCGESYYKNHVFYKVTKLLERKANIYPITNVEPVLEVLEQQFGMGFNSNIKAVINNYIARCEYSTAHQICDEYKKTVAVQSEDFKYLESIKKEIRKAEIGQIILRGIQVDASEEEQNAFFEVIEKKMQENKYNYNMIPLGYTKDGRKKITLADIWDEERNLSR